MGNQQDASDVGMTMTAPAVNTTAVFNMAALAAKENRHDMTCDIGGALLHANIPDDTNVHVELDKIMSDKTRYRTHRTEKGTVWITPSGTIMVQQAKPGVGIEGLHRKSSGPMLLEQGQWPWTEHSVIPCR